MNTRISQADTTIKVNGEALRFDESALSLSSGANLTINSNGGAITAEKRIRNDAGGASLTINAGTTSGSTDTVSLAGIGFGDAMGDIDITAADGITLTSGVHTVGSVRFRSPVTISGSDIYIDTVENTADTTDTDGSVTFDSTLDGTQALWVLTGSGTVTFSDAIGATTPLTGLAVNTGADHTGNSIGNGVKEGVTVSIANIGTSSAAGVSGATLIGNSETGSVVNLTGTVYNTNAATYTAATGENIDLTGAATTTFTSSNDDITFGTATVEMGNGSNLVIDTDTLGGAIDLASGVMGTSSENITLTAGTGTVAIGSIGTGTEIADVSITTTGNTTISGDFTGGSLTNSGPAIVSDNVNLSTTGVVNFGSTLDSSNGSQSITFVTATDITITGVVGGTNPFSTFTITDGDTFTYSGGGSIAGFSSGKFSRTGGFKIFNPGPSIDNINTIEKTQDKEIAFFDAPVFKLFKSFLAPTVTDLINEKVTTSVDSDLPEIISTSPAKSNDQFLEKSLILK